MSDWGDPLPEEERDALVERIARAVVRRRMETPAILFLEMHRPVSFIAGQSLVVLSPFVGPFVGIENVQIISRLLESRDNIDCLIRRIEELSVERTDAAKIPAEKEA